MMILLFFLPFLLIKSVVNTNGIVRMGHLHNSSMITNTVSGLPVGPEASF